MHELLARAPKYAPLVLRVGIAAVIIWFGANQLLSANAWTIWVPDWASITGLSDLTIVYLNGGFEVIAGTLLLLRVWKRPIAFLLFLHMCLIVFDIGFNPIGMRDAAIAVALLALAMQEE